MLRSSGFLQVLRSTSWKASKQATLALESTFIAPRTASSYRTGQCSFGLRYFSSAASGENSETSTGDNDRKEDEDEDEAEDEAEEIEEEDDEYYEDEEEYDDEDFAATEDDEFKGYQSRRRAPREDPFENVNPELKREYEEFLEKGLEDVPDLDIGDSDPLVPYNWMKGMDPREANLRCYFLESDFPHKENSEVRKQIMSSRGYFDPEYDCLPHSERNAIINLVEQYENQECWHPVINPELKENLYQTWASDKEFWTLDKLSQRFRLKKLRVEAILLLKIEEKRLMRERPEAVIEEGDQIDYMYAMEFGMIGTDGWTASEIDDRYELSESVGGRPSIGGVDEEVDLNKAFQHAYASWKYPNSLPVNPPNPEARKDGQPIRGPDTRVRNGRKRKPTCKRPKILFVDSSDVPNREMDGLMIIKEPDGSQRHATWDERREFYRKSMTGERARKAFPIYKRALDPIIFPVDDEEEKLMRTQFDDIRQPWARPMFVTDKESFMLSMKRRHPVERAELWRQSEDLAAGYTPPSPSPTSEDSDLFDVPNESPFEKYM